MGQRTRVAVIGGGAAGLVSARWLQEEGLEVVVFETAGQLGGVWRYDGDAPDSSNCTYKSLRPNAPTEVMQLRDFPYAPGVVSYPTHHELGDYLRQYAAHFGVDKLVRFRTTVTSVTKTSDGQQWNVTLQTRGPNKAEDAVTEVFDRLMICNGHYSKPYYVPVKGIEHFRGEVMHSQTYREPDRFVGKNILLIGLGQSGKEISIELAANGVNSVTVAHPKYTPPTETPEQEQPDRTGERLVITGFGSDGSLLLSDGSVLPESSFVEFRDRIFRATFKDDTRVMKPKIDHITPDGSTVVFTDGSSIPAPDTIMFCTGYVYAASDFIPSDLLYPKALDIHSDAELQLGAELANELRVAAETGFAVAPLYKQVVSIEDPSVAFIGLPFDTVPFQCNELQAMWVAQVFSGARSLASREDMYEDFYASVRKAALPLGRNFHQLGMGRGPEYFSELAELSGTKLDRLASDLLDDSVSLAFSFPAEFRSASYVVDPLTGKCTRRFRPRDGGEELVRTFC